MKLLRELDQELPGYLNIMIDLSVLETYWVDGDMVDKIGKRRDLAERQRGLFYKKGGIL